MWKVRVTKVSEVASTGVFEVGFEVLVDGVVKYPNYTVTTSSRQDLRNRAIEIVNNLKAVEVEKLKVQVGEEFTV